MALVRCGQGGDHPRRLHSAGHLAHHPREAIAYGGPRGLVSVLVRALLELSLDRPRGESVL